MTLLPVFPGREVTWPDTRRPQARFDSSPHSSRSVSARAPWQTGQIGQKNCNLSECIMFLFVVHTIAIHEYILRMRIFGISPANVIVKSLVIHDLVVFCLFFPHILPCSGKGAWTWMNVYNVYTYVSCLYYMTFL